MVRYRYSSPPGWLLLLLAAGTGSGGSRSRSVLDVAGVDAPLLAGGMVLLPEAERVRSRRRRPSVGIGGGGAVEEPRRGLEEEEREKSLGIRPRERVEEGP